jgi:peroxiredoxin
MLQVTSLNHPAMKKLFSALAMLLVASVAILVASGVDSGRAAPDFTLPSADASTVSLSQYRGKVVVLEWFNHNCPFVHKFYDDGYMQKWQVDAAAKGVVWLTIDSTNPAHKDYLSTEAAAAEFKRLKMASAHLLLDADGKVGRLYGATNTPQVYVIGPDGTLLYQGAVDDRRTSDASDVSRANNFLNPAIDAILSGGSVATPSTRPYGCSVKYAK